MNDGGHQTQDGDGKPHDGDDVQRRGVLKRLSEGLEHKRAALEASQRCRYSPRALPILTHNAAKLVVWLQKHLRRPPEAFPLEQPAVLQSRRL